MLPFTIAEKKSQLHRIGIEGMSGSGKTFSSLSLASFLSSRCGSGNPPILIDVAEGGKSLGLAEKFPHLIGYVELSNNMPSLRSFLDLMRNASGHVVIIDSLSSIWESLLAHKGMMDEQNPQGGIRNWNRIGTLWQKVINSISCHSNHLIATIRCKNKIVSDGNGKWTKLPEAAIIRPGTEFDFGVWCHMFNQTITVEQPRNYENLVGLTAHEPANETWELFL